VKTLSGIDFWHGFGLFSYPSLKSQTLPQAKKKKLAVLWGGCSFMWLLGIADGHSPL
jgi:hypothetical protein